jgi:NADH-quinone oxidoreductase subunit L
VILGVLTVGGGLINLPHFAGGQSWLAHWLEPVTQVAMMVMKPLPEVAPPGEALLVLLAIGAAVVGLIGGYVVTSRAAIVTPEQAPPERGLWRVLYHKFYVDEVYQFLIVNPVMWFSRTVLWRTVDAFLIDRIGVGGTARVAEGLGWLGSRLQNGQVAFYVAMFAVGAVLILRALVR